MKRWINRLCALLLLLLSTYSLLGMLLDTLETQADPALFLWVFGLCILAWLAANFRYGFAAAIPLTAGLLLAAYRSFSASPAEEFSALLQSFSEIVTGAGGAAEAPELNFSFTLLLCTLIIAVWMAAALSSRSARIIFGLLGTLPVFGLCLSVNGHPPALSALGLALFWILLLVSGGSWSPEGNGGRTVLLTALPLAALLVLLLLILPPSGYSFTDEQAAFSQKVDRYFRSINERIIGTTSSLDDQTQTQTLERPRPVSAPLFRSSWDLNGEDLDLSRPYDETLDLQLVLRLRCDSDGIVYLRTRSYGDYTGTRWLAAPQAPCSSLDYTAAAVQSSSAPKTHSAAIEQLCRLDALCIPYYCVTQSPLDQSAPASGLRYSLTYRETREAYTTLTLPDEYRADEAAYRVFAHEVYTRLPEQTRADAERFCLQAGLSADSDDLIDRVAELVRSSGVYDLTVEPFDTEDYALCFLETAHRGFCVHFASAAAVLYRSLGIPARITEGFLVEAVRDRDVEVTGVNAHAWVEVYRDGLGWIPVEVTGFSGGVNGEGTEPQPEPSKEAEPDPEHSPDQEKSPETAQPGRQELSVGVIGEQEAEEPQHGAAAWLLRLLMGLGFVFAVMALRYGLLRWRFSRSTQPARGASAAIAMWKYAEKAARFGAEIPETIQNSAEKAAFSQHSLSADELKRAEADLQKMLKRTDASLRFWKRLFFRYLFGLR